MTPLNYAVHGILQAKIRDWVAVHFSRGSSRPRNRPRSPAWKVEKNLLENPFRIMRTLLTKDQSILLNNQPYLPPEKSVCRSRSNS